MTGEHWTGSPNLGGRFDIFYFFCSGRGKGESEAPGGGEVRFLLKIPGGLSPEGRGAEGPGGCLRRIGDLGGGGGVNFFFSGLNVHQETKASIKTRTAIYRSLRALRAQNPQKVSKKSPRASGPGVSKKSRKESKSLKKVSEKSLFDTFLTFLTLFETFWTLRARRPGETFWRLFGDFGPRGPGDSCKWPFGSQSIDQK